MVRHTTLMHIFLSPSRPRVFLAVWIVSNQQLLAWVQDPKPISGLGDVDALKCPTPQVSQKICNGMPENEDGLLQHCAFSDFPWYTCVSLYQTSMRMLRIQLCHAEYVVWMSHGAGVPFKPESAPGERVRAAGPLPDFGQLQHPFLGPNQRGVYLPGRLLSVLRQLTAYRGMYPISSSSLSILPIPRLLV